MMGEMSDDTFISYCEAHSLTERAGFVPVQLARICRLAGYDKIAEAWEREHPQRIVSADLRGICKEARERIARKG
jgi:hypothetical protein